MSKAFQHSPADVVRWLLVAGQYGTSPVLNPLQAWPIYESVEPSSPDDCITVYDTASQEDGRSMPDGESLNHYGVQIRVRGVDKPTAFARGELIRVGIAEAQYQDKLTIAGADYLVNNFSGIGSLVGGWRDSPQSERRFYTLNCFVSMRAL